MTETVMLSEPLGAKPRQLGAAEYARLARELKLAGPQAHLRAVRLGVLSSCTLQFLEPSLVVEGARRDLQLSVQFGPFGQFEQLLANAESDLFAFQPEVLLLFMRPEDLYPDFAYRFYTGDDMRALLRSTVERLVNCARLFRQFSSAPVLVGNFATPPSSPLGPFAANVDDSVAYLLAEANRTLRAELSAVADATVWDYAGVVRDAGAESWTDPRLWALARVPVASDRQPILARHLARTLAGLFATPAKCLVLDLDNTLWGGVIGDDGLEGIQLGDDYPGVAFKNFQRAVLGLADRGILLAIVSKNYPEVVEQALREHPEMLIRPEHIAAMRVNWSAKSQNLLEIARELNIGVDALVHFDDNPMERAEIAANAPAVRLIDVPTDPLGYVRALSDCGFFDTRSVSQEDRQRVEMYRTERARDEVRAKSGSVEAFLDDLAMVAEVGAVDSANLGRVAQLLGKTNQFNLTTRRHSQSEISRMSTQSDYTAIYVRLRDRFGDLGLIAVGLIAYQGDEAVIDSFVMSCRAMGRQAENALAWALADAARQRGCSTLIGDYIPTPRNGIVADLYPSLGFSALGPLENGGQRFALDLSETTLEWPSVIRQSLLSNQSR
ncbi:MAG TPA: HAD-IIIC family phosphatase [Longimicrobiales bacterium]